MQNCGECKKLEGVNARVLEQEELKEFLIKNWMTHDGMWFLHCMQECGIEKTNKINRAAVRSMAKVELKRLKEIFGIDQVRTFAEFQAFVEAIFNIIKANFMDFTCEFPAFNVFKFTMNNCFAHDGIKRMGALDHYQCGIFERIETWFHELGVDYEIAPQVIGCMMHSENQCFRIFKFDFNE
jgi:hypothetical protein